MIQKPRPATHRVDRAFADALVARAAITFNTRDLTSIIDGYESDATLELCSEGLEETFRGTTAIEQAWRTAFTVFPKMQVAKEVVSVDPDAGSIVNEWTGSVDGRSSAYGLDLWWIDPASRRVVRHKVISFNRTVPARSLAGRLRWLLIHPGSVVRLVRALR